MGVAGQTGGSAGAGGGKTGTGGAYPDDGGSGATDAADARDGATDVVCGSPADTKNCGTCGHDCTALQNVSLGATGIECRAGACFVPATACVSGYGHCSSRPDDGCEASLTDSANCGACGTKCTGGTGLCTQSASGAKCASSCVAPAPDLCVSSCVDLKTDPRNCGMCGHDCTALPSVSPGATGIECRAGACFVPPAACAAGYGHCSTRADDGCETSLRTVSNCGQCGKPCTTPTGLCSTATGTPTCSSSCVAPSPDLCSSKCVSLASDPTNCGACNHNCTTLTNVRPGATGVECRSGVCYVPPGACASGHAHCSARPDDGCEADLSTPANCGSCSLVCSGATPLCSLQSTPASCLPNCGGSTPDICGAKCVNKPTDAKNCGACGHDCGALLNVKPGATAPAVQCVAGTCVVQPAGCVSGFGHCTSRADDGCETDLTKPATCGSCTNMCVAPTALCSTAGGSPTCSSSCTSPNPDLCGSKCVNKTTDPTNCGACAHDCTVLPHINNTAAVTCSSTGGCVVSQSACALGFANCSTSSNDVDGCETPTNTTANCGGCGVPCAIMNGIGNCSTGVCVKTCPASAPNLCPGICTDIKGNDAANCGACGHSCLGGLCQGGVCLPQTIAMTANGVFVGALAVNSTTVFTGDDANLYAVPKSKANGAPIPLLSSIAKVPSSGGGPSFIAATDSLLMVAITFSDRAGVSTALYSCNPTNCMATLMTWFSGFSGYVTCDITQQRCFAQDINTGAILLSTPGARTPQPFPNAANQVNIALANTANGGAALTAAGGFLYSAGATGGAGPLILERVPEDGSTSVVTRLANQGNTFGSVRPPVVVTSSRVFFAGTPNGLFSPTFIYTVPLPLGAGNSPAPLFAGSTDFSGGTYYADNNAAFWFDMQLQQLVTCPQSGCTGAAKAIASAASTFLTSDGQALYWIGPGGSSIIKLAR